MKIEARQDFSRSAQEAAVAKVDRLVKLGTVFRKDAANVKEIGVSFAHRCFWLTEQALTGAAPLHECAEERGWRFMILYEGAPVAAVQSWYERGAWQVSAVRGGATAYGMRKALEVAAAHASGDQNAFEPCNTNRPNSKLMPHRECLRQAQGQAPKGRRAHRRRPLVRHREDHRHLHTKRVRQLLRRSRI